MIDKRMEITAWTLDITISCIESATYTVHGCKFLLKNSLFLPSVFLFLFDMVGSSASFQLLLGLPLFLVPSTCDMYTLLVILSSLLSICPNCFSIRCTTSLSYHHFLFNHPSLHRHILFLNISLPAYSTTLSLHFCLTDPTSHTHIITSTVVPSNKLIFALKDRDLSLLTHSSVCPRPLPPYPPYSSHQLSWFYSLPYQLPGN